MNRYFIRIPSCIVFSLLFLLLFLIAPFGVTQFEIPKVLFAEFGIVVLFLFFLLSNNLEKYFSYPYLLFPAAIFLLTLIDLLFLRTDISFFGNAFRMQGIFLLWLLLLFSILSSAFSFTKIPWFIYTALLVLELLLTLFLPQTESNRYVGTLGEPNALAAVVIFLWPFSFFSIQKFKTSEIVGIVLTLFSVITLLVLSGSKSATVAFAVQIIFICLMKLKIDIRKSTFICLLLYLFSLFLPLFQQTLYENRQQIWQAALFAGWQNAFIGNGFGNTENALARTSSTLNLAIKYSYIDSAHNIFFDWWVQGGIIGAGILLVLIYFTFKNFIGKKNTRNIVLLLGMLTVLSFNPASVVELLAFWWLIGQGLFSEKL